MADKYHHGNLRQALIDAGIKIINEKGEDALSLRKVAAECGVSHAAPYAHFADKDALLAAIKSSVTDQFMEQLTMATQRGGKTSTERAIFEMGKQYILFFKENPDYFLFLFGKQQLNVHLSMKEEHPEDYAPYLLLRELFQKYLQENNISMSTELKEIELIKTWVIVHGISAVVCMPGVTPPRDWEDMLEQLLSPSQV